LQYFVCLKKKEGHENILNFDSLFKEKINKYNINIKSAIIKISLRISMS